MNNHRSLSQSFLLVLLTCIKQPHIMTKKERKRWGNPSFLFLSSLPYFREGNGTSLQYSCLENPMNRGAWWAAVHGVTKSWTRLSDFTFTFHFHALEKEMATHFSVLAWRIPGTGEPGGLPSLGLHRVGYDWSDLAAAAASLLMSEPEVESIDKMCASQEVHCSSLHNSQDMETN